MSHHMCHVRQTQTSSSAGCISHSSFWWQEGEFMNFWILFVIVEEDTVSPTSFSAAAFLSFAYLHPYNLFRVALSWCTLLSCWWWGCWTQSLNSLGNDSQTSWWQNRHFHHSSQRRGQTSIPHAYRQILFLLFSLVAVFTGWGYVSVCESSSPQQPQQQQQSSDQSPSSSVLRQLH